MPALLQKIMLLVCLTLLLNACEGQKKYSEVKENSSSEPYINYLKIKKRARAGKKTDFDAGEISSIELLITNSKNLDSKWPSTLPDWLVPPPKDMMVAQVLTKYVNPETGESYEANTAGYQLMIQE